MGSIPVAGAKKKHMSIWTYAFFDACTANSLAIYKIYSPTRTSGVSSSMTM